MRIPRRKMVILTSLTSLTSFLEFVGKNEFLSFSVFYDVTENVKMRNRRFCTRRSKKAGNEVREVMKPSYALEFSLPHFLITSLQEKSIFTCIKNKNNDFY